MLGRYDNVGNADEFILFRILRESRNRKIQRLVENPLCATVMFEGGGNLFAKFTIRGSGNYR